MASKEYYDKLAYACRLIRKSGLTESPFRVRVVPASKLPEGVLGDCNENGLIRIRSGLPGYVAVDVFLHEIGHHISTQSHGVVWAQAYSKVYNWYIKNM